MAAVARAGGAASGELGRNNVVNADVTKAMDRLPRLSTRDALLGAAFMLAPAMTVLVGALLGGDRGVVMLSGLLVFFSAGWLNERFPACLE